MTTERRKGGDIEMMIKRIYFSTEDVDDMIFGDSTTVPSDR